MMQFEDLLQLYERMRDRYGTDTYNHISELLREAKQIHKKISSKDPQSNAQYKMEKYPITNSHGDHLRGEFLRS